MKKIKIIALLTLIICCIILLPGCGDSGNNNSNNNGNTNNNKPDVEISQTEKETHYLKFMENNAEILRIVVLENETYEDLLPYFPTLTKEEGFIKYWDGDYNYTSYNHKNQFKVYDENDLIIEIYSYSRKAD